MTNDEFEQLVFQLEEKARANPALYKFRVLLLALLGNAYLLTMLFIIASLFLLLIASITVLKLIAIKLILIVGVFLWMLLKSLWVSVPPPKGFEINSSQSPELFKMINSLRKELGAPKFHRVLIDNELNAAVAQIPRLGVFGWYQNYLILGLPLLKSLTVEQFKAVLAHEFGHLAKGHGRFSNWIYRQRLRWSQLQRNLERNNSRGRFLFVPFLNWFSPYFNAYTFPLARANEYEADATSVRLTSAQHAAEALTAVNVVGDYLNQRYWPEIHKQAESRPQPNFAPYANMDQRVSNELNEETAKKWLENALAEKTSSADTHPALVDRLAAIGATARLAPPLAGEAADSLLGKALEHISREFDQNWQKNITAAWQNRYDEFQADRAKLAELNSRYAEGNELSIQDAFERARLTESVGEDSETALTLFKALCERIPEDAYANLHLGARLLGRDDNAGYYFVERAMQLNEKTTLQACEILRDFCWRQGEKERAHEWHNQLQQRAETEHLAELERSQVLIKDRFEPHELSEISLEKMRAQLAKINDIADVYLVKKHVNNLPHYACYVLGFRVKGLVKLNLVLRSRKIIQALQETVDFPGETLIINIEGKNSRFYRKFKKSKDAKI